MEDIATANRFALAIRDMENVQRYLSALRKLIKMDAESGKNDFKVQIEAIFMSALVVYSRPFKKSNTQGNADRSIDLKKNDLFDSKPELQVLHEMIIERRDKAIAHSDWEYHSSNLVEVYDNGLTKRNYSRPDYMKDIGIERLQELAEFVCRTCMKTTYCLDRGKTLSESS